MPTWGLVVIGVASVVVASGVIWRKVVSPAANLISTAEKGAPVFRRMVSEFADMPELLSVLRAIAQQFQTDSGSSLRDLCERLETLAEINRLAIEALVARFEALVTQEASAAVQLTTGQEALRILAQDDRVQIAALLAELRRVKLDEAVVERDTT